jgi:predicted SAM-dependent methyltransferase
MRLEIGCGERPKEGYVHLDNIKLPHVEIIDNAETLEKIEDGSCEEILAVQVIEHFSHTKTLSILKTWYQKLAPNGILQLEVPDLKLFCTLWVNGYIKEHWAFISIYGEQTYEGNFHKAGFTKEYLHYLLIEAGFNRVEDLMGNKPNPNCEIKLKAYKYG